MNMETELVYVCEITINAAYRIDACCTVKMNGRTCPVKYGFQSLYRNMNFIPKREVWVQPCLCIGGLSKTTSMQCPKHDFHLINHTVGSTI